MRARLHVLRLRAGAARLPLVAAVVPQSGGAASTEWMRVVAGHPTGDGMLRGRVYDLSRVHWFGWRGERWELVATGWAVRPTPTDHAIGHVWSGVERAGVADMARGGRTSQRRARYALLRAIAAAVAATTAVRPCGTCHGARFTGYGSGYGDVCDDCAGSGTEVLDGQ